MGKRERGKEGKRERGKEGKASHRGRRGKARPGGACGSVEAANGSRGDVEMGAGAAGVRESGEVSWTERHCRSKVVSVRKRETMAKGTVYFVEISGDWRLGLVLH